MKGILIAGVFAAFAITVIDSLDCRQCTTNDDIKSCKDEASSCGESTDFVSCVESLVNSTLGGSQPLYQERSCSASNCETIIQADFTVRLPDAQQYHFVSQCCQGEACKDTDPGPRNLTNTQCSSCYSTNQGACNETTQQCFEGEQCVHIIVQHGSGEESVTEELKGCSDISDATCKALDSESAKIGEFTFQKVNCTKATIIPEVTTTTTPTTVTTTPSTVTTTPSTSTTIKASFISSVFGSLLLLKLLF
ncbi:ly6/PLAUR domain-containing protein 8-like [Alexandromys fortis]|uniref:ly6/PLAUR domain-containing protein 8-like n=1 Tax=Alexandromys fortis TaxID=100897 RepID=UPI0021530260|nr:ly6/PLAUR domain-containing protein 8-like [Microtus fortis]